MYILKLNRIMVIVFVFFGINSWSEERIESSEVRKVVLVF